MSQSTSSDTNRTNAYWVSFCLLAFAGLLATNPLPFKSPISAPLDVPSWATDTTTVRQPDMKPEYGVGVFEYRCSDCHAIIPAAVSDRDRIATQHQEIELRHGINTSCFNCHHRSNRDALVDDLGDEIPWNQPQLLCARCHGPVYRDWQHGSHGRTNGYWDTSLGDQVRRKCIECHDPHSPSFPALHPAPGPHALRADPHDVADHPGSHNPLRLHTSAKPVETRESAAEGH